MDTAVVKLYALPYSVGAAPKYHDFLFIAWLALILFTVSRVIIRSIRVKFSGACIDKAVNGHYSELLPCLEYLNILSFQKKCYLFVGITIFLYLQEKSFILHKVFKAADR